MAENDAPNQDHDLEDVLDMLQRLAWRFAAVLTAEYNHALDDVLGEAYSVLEHYGRPTSQPLTGEAAEMDRLMRAIIEEVADRLERQIAAQAAQEAPDGQ